MEEFEQAFFISYAQGGENEEIVIQIDQTLQQHGLRIIRDKRNLGYKGSIRAFMERIGQGNSCSSLARYRAGQASSVFPDAGLQIILKKSLPSSPMRAARVHWWGLSVITLFYHKKDMLLQGYIR